jgi:metallo-beta-lactamase family protein
MRTSIQFLGGAGTVTGSKFLVESGKDRVLVDCGLFQGLKELRLQNWAPFPVNPQSIDSVLLTHAHLDHCGYLPLLARNGFSGRVYCTAPTRDLCKVILYDSAKLQEEDAERANAGGYSKHSPAEPLYTAQDVKKALKLIRVVSRDEWIQVSKAIQARFTHSGHILGSSLIELKAPDATIAFTGDLGRSDPLILHPPDFIREADYVVVESTYGDRLHSPLSPLKELGRIVRETVDREGHVIIPAFAVGRTQDILFLLSTLRRQSQIPDVPVFLDSPMGIDATEIFTEHADWHRLLPGQVEHLRESVTLLKTRQESEDLLRRKESSIVIAGSGMLTGGRVLTHLARRLPDARNTVVLVGYQPAATRGSLLKNGITELKIYGQYIPVRARIEEISTLSAHADQKDIIRWLGHIKTPPKQVFIVHGEPQGSDALRVRIGDALGWKSVTPKQGEKFEL